ncbi:hypothetical protein HKBW3S47_01092 [Candidatus Hakubella thermalkaliphila]|uniref:Protein-export membrane protein SecG n=1 Tax=Candidatus Hakubella thermalkaliphila TaxID=2754717 RepID=A0A6V8Q4F9_9ACTN|nr:hypothetical protein HKBW3S47_01092 [Candidatus Hakubella thermalkaliphila]
MPSTSKSATLRNILKKGVHEMNSWYIIALYVIHTIVSLALIFFILLHSGRGGGLSEAFGSVVSSFASSGIVEKNLNRITIALSIVFGITTLVLVILL